MLSSPQTLLHLLQLASPALPIGAYSYSEGLETLVQSGAVMDVSSLKQWLVQDLAYGTSRLEAAIIVRAYDSVQQRDWDGLRFWNQWSSAVRETEELREQSWQMGRSLSRLLVALQPQIEEVIDACGEPCNTAIAFAIAAAHWQIDRETAVLGYLYSWAANLINAGVRLIPLGQTQGQQLLLALYPDLENAAIIAQTLADDDLQSCSWGLAIASMSHETLYSRLFRS
jgi:urease accessory protein